MAHFRKLESLRYIYQTYINILISGQIHVILQYSKSFSGEFMKKKILQFIKQSYILILKLLVILVILGIISSFFWIEPLFSDPTKPIDAFTHYYICSQIILLLFVLIILWSIKGWKAHTNTVASILTIAGVFGTFIGIIRWSPGIRD